MAIAVHELGTGQRRQGIAAAPRRALVRPVRRRGLPPRVRRRLAGAVLAVALVAVGVLAGTAGGADAAGPDASAASWPGSAAPAAGPTSPPPVVVVIAPGDTVWELARTHVPPGEGLQTYVTEVLELNDLDGSALRPGSALRLPVR